MVQICKLNFHLVVSLQGTLDIYTICLRDAQKILNEKKPKNDINYLFNSSVVCIGKDSFVFCSPVKNNYCVMTDMCLQRSRKFANKQSFGQFGKYIFV